MKRVLFAEDEALIAFLFEDALTEAGYEVMSALDGDKANGLIETKFFDALITDIRLPGSLSGWDVATKLREVNPGAAVIFMTGDSMPEHDQRGVPGSVMHHKPVPVEDVVQSLHKLLSSF